MLVSQPSSCPLSCSPAPASSSASSCFCWAEALGPKPSLRLGCSPDAAILAGHQSPPNSAGCKAPFQAGAAARRNLGSSPSDRQAAELVNSSYSRNCATNRMLRHGRNTPPLSVTDSAIAPSARMHPLAQLHLSSRFRHRPSQAPSTPHPLEGNSAAAARPELQPPLPLHISPSHPPSTQAERGSSPSPHMPSVACEVTDAAASATFHHTCWCGCWWCSGGARWGCYTPQKYRKSH